MAARSSGTGNEQVEPSPFLAALGIYRNGFEYD